MLNCTDVRPILSTFIEKETDPLQTLETRRHLDNCSACQRRADRLAGVMNACSAMSDAEPSASIADAVMKRLRGMKSRAVAAGTVDLAAKWTGLMVLLAAGATAVMSPATPALRALGRPIHALIGLVAGTGSGENARNLLSSAGPAILRFLDGETASEIAAGAGLDLSISLQVLASGLLFGFLLIIPVAIVTAWMLHNGSRG
jgi:anti-sigma factor RsiW